MEIFSFHDGEEQGETYTAGIPYGCLSTILFKIAGYGLNDLWKHPIGNCALCRVDIGEEGTMHIGEWGRDDYIPPDLKMKVPSAG